jgi:uncharacterized protein
VAPKTRLGSLARMTAPTSTDPVGPTSGPDAPRHRSRRLPTVEIVAMLIIAVVFLQPWLRPLVDSPALQTWSTILLAITIQAAPFLALGVAVSGLIAALLPPGWLARATPSRTGLSVPLASCAGLALPGCECGSVPIAGRLIGRGAPAAPALAFMLSAPAINPIVLAATAVAFPGEPRIVLARFLASFATAMVVGFVWARVGGDRYLELARHRVRDRGTRWGTFVATTTHDFVHAGGYLVIGAGVAAAIQVWVPIGILDTIASTPVLAVLTMATLAIVLSICSEADAFIAASLPQFSLTARLVFMVVGPVVDLKLIALQAGIFGRRFTVRFVPLALGVSMGAALIAGGLLL